MMQSTIRRRPRAKKGVSEIIAAVFMILIIFVAFAVFTVMFNSYVSYTQTANQAAQQIAQNQQTFLSSNMQFGSSIATAPNFNVNSIGSSTVQTHYPFERKLVYSQGLWWAFYSSGTAIVYQTSAHGISWTATATLTSLAGSAVSYGFSVWLGSGGILYFVLAPYFTGAGTFTVAKVPLNSGGTIGSVTTSTITLAANYDAGAYSSITNDTSGNIWVALNIDYTKKPITNYVEVYRCTTALVCTATDGTAPPSITFSNANDIVPMILGMSNGALAVLFSNSGGTAQAFTTLSSWLMETCTPGTTGAQCQGPTAPATWSAPVTTTSTYYADLTSAVAIGNVVYFAGANATAVSTWSFTYGSATIPKAFQIDSGVSGTAAPISISEDGSGSVLGTGNMLAVTYGSGTNVFFSNSTTDSVWSTRQTISTSENNVLGISSTYSGTQEGAIWTSGAASPFVIRFGEVNVILSNLNILNPSTVDTSTTNTATSSSVESKLFYDLGLWWDFFAVGNGIDFATSSDGLVWSAPTSVITSAAYSGAATGSDFSVDLSGNTVYWCLSSGGAAASFDYNSGTLSSSGTITFGTTATIATAYTSSGPVSIGVDVSGNAWVALTTLQAGPTYHIEIYEHNSGAANTFWSSNIAPASLPVLSATANSAITGLQTAAGAVLVAETSGTVGTGVISIYSTTTSSLWTASTWTAAVSPPSKYALASSSDTLVGSTLAFAGLSSSSLSVTSGTLSFWTFVIGSASTSSEQTIEATTNNWQSAIGSDGSTIFLFDANISTISYYYTGNLGYTWSTQAFASVEPSIQGLSAASDNTIAVTWTSGNPSFTTVNVRFAALSALAVTNNSGSAVHLDSLYVSQPSTNTLLTYYVTNSSELLDYWVGPGATAYVALTFAWVTSTAYQVTIGTSTGVVSSIAATSPT